MVDKVFFKNYHNLIFNDWTMILLTSIICILNFNYSTNVSEIVISVFPQVINIFSLLILILHLTFIKANLSQKIFLKYLLVNFIIGQFFLISYFPCKQYFKISDNYLQNFIFFISLFITLLSFNRYVRINEANSLDLTYIKVFDVIISLFASLLNTRYNFSFIILLTFIITYLLRFPARIESFFIISFIIITLANILILVSYKFPRDKTNFRKEIINYNSLNLLLVTMSILINLDISQFNNYLMLIKTTICLYFMLMILQKVYLYIKNFEDESLEKN